VPSVDVYLIHWRAPDWCVESAASVLESVGVCVRCHVIDNGATGGGELASRLDPRVIIETTPTNLGYTGAANVALAHAMKNEPRADFVVVAAHDLLVEPNTLRELSNVARADPSIGVLGPVLTAPARSAGGWWRGWRAKATSSFDESRAFNEREWVSGTLLFLLPECIRQIGGLDEALGSYVEDVDLCLRARDASWKVGIATGARASGIGSASEQVTMLVDVNSLLLAVKRRGLRACPGIVARYAYWVGRGVIASVLPGRTPERRRASLAHARDHARALGQIARSSRRIRLMAREPERGVPKFA
jgi:hypothetical protein